MADYTLQESWYDGLNTFRFIIKNIGNVDGTGREYPPDNIDPLDPNGGIDQTPVGTKFDFICLLQVSTNIDESDNLEFYNNQISENNLIKRTTKFNYNGIEFHPIELINLGQFSDGSKIIDIVIDSESNTEYNLKKLYSSNPTKNEIRNIIVLYPPLKKNDKISFTLEYTKASILNCLKDNKDYFVFYDYYANMDKAFGDTTELNSNNNIFNFTYGIPKNIPPLSDIPLTIIDLKPNYFLSTNNGIGSLNGTGVGTIDNLINDTFDYDYENPLSVLPNQIDENNILTIQSINSENIIITFDFDNIQVNEVLILDIYFVSLEIFTDFSNTFSTKIYKDDNLIEYKNNLSFEGPNYYSRVIFNSLNTVVNKVQVIGYTNNTSALWLYFGIAEIKLVKV